jgi:hypothetical protein
MTDMVLLYLLGVASGMNLAGAIDDFRLGDRKSWLLQLAVATWCAVSAGMIVAPK